MPDYRNLPLLLAGAIAIAALLLAAPGGTRPAEAISNCNVVNTTADGEEQAFLGLINNYRIANQLQPLTLSANLNRAAEWTAADLGHRAIFSHTDSLGRGPQQRIADCGGAPWFGENLAAGTRISTATSAFSIWRSSGGHNRNMLLADYKQIGIARYYAPSSRYKWYWVTTFSVVNDGTSAAGATGATGATGLFNPVPGTKLTGSTVRFEWSDMGADEYWLTVGTVPAGYNLYSAALGLGRQATVSNLPTYGGTIYVRQWSRHGGLWRYTDYTYIAAN